MASTVRALSAGIAAVGVKHTGRSIVSVTHIGEMGLAHSSLHNR